VLGRIAQKLQEAISQPFRIEDHDIYVTSSIGISVFPDDSDDPEELMKHADVAMYRSKELGRNTYQFLDADLAERRLRQHTLETALRGALKDNALKLYYQPVVRISDRAIVGAEALLRWTDADLAERRLRQHTPETALRGALKDNALRLYYQPLVRITDRAIVGAEALLRWTDPDHGVVPPQVFIPLAEESGLIHALGDWVLKTAAAQCAQWRASGLPLRISVNLSAKQFYRDDLAQRITEIVRGEGCEPSWLELEVTETSLMHDLDAIRKVLHQLRGEGFTVAIDDFGTGYSSLTHLKHFPIDTLKIDISFIADLETDPGDAAITEAIIGLARGIGLKVVAEGVGTRAQLDFLDVRGCHCFQGYWVSKPLPAQEFIEFVGKRPQ
jgi:EAL domain-containing protein (putative c-di-GMP-specific phosphodiesterase class I)